MRKRILIATLVTMLVIAGYLFGGPPSVQLQSFTLSTGEVPGGVAVIGTLALNKNATGSGVDVNILGIDSAIANAPTSIHFNKGERTKTFTIIGIPRCDQIQLTVVCTLGISINRPLIIRNPLITSIQLVPNPVIGGNPVQGTVTLDGPAPNCP